YNLHLDHRSPPSRERSTALLAERIRSRTPRAPVVVTGDFNAGEDNPAIETLRTLPEGGAFLVDTFRVRHRAEGTVGTFNGFERGSTDGDKIDYVFAEPATEVLDARVVRTSREGRYPSDHFPVVARIRFAK
ncbi:MAG: endonuclease/exonuclease/phosphatase family protein, partial [Vicinamibacteraceae bacterium]